MPLPEGITAGEGATATTQALHFGANAKLELPNLDYFASDKPFSMAVWMYQPKREDNITIVSQSDPQDKGRGWALEVNSRQPSFKLVGDEGKGLRVSAGFFEQFKVGTWNHLLVTYDGSRQPAGLVLYLNGKKERSADWGPGRATEGRDSNRRSAAVWQRRDPIFSRRRDA